MKRSAIDRFALGQIIFRHRLQAGLSQTELARRTQINPTSISKYESGKIAIGRRNLEKLSAALGSTAPQFISEAWELSGKSIAPQSAVPEPVFPEGELGRIWDESVENAKNLHIRSCRALFDALLKAFQAR